MKFRRWLDEDEASSTLMVLAQSPCTISATPSQYLSDDESHTARDPARAILLFNRYYIWYQGEKHGRRGGQLEKELGTRLQW